MSGGNWQQSASAAAPAWTATAGDDGGQWGGEERTSVASSQEFAFNEEFASEQARSSSVPADMYFGASNVHELSQQQQQQMPHLSDHILDEESFPL